MTIYVDIQITLFSILIKGLWSWCYNSITTKQAAALTPDGAGHELLAMSSRVHAGQQATSSDG